MKRCFLIIITICFFINSNTVFADVFSMSDDFALDSHIQSLDTEMNNINNFIDIANDVPIVETLNLATIGFDDFALMNTSDDVLATASNDLNDPLDLNNEYDKLTLDLNDSVNDLNTLIDFTVDMIDDPPSDTDILEGEIISDTDTNDLLNIINNDDDDIEDSNENDDDDDVEEDPSENSDTDDDGDDENTDAFLFDLFIPQKYVYADAITKNSTKKFFLKTNDYSYIISTEDPYIAHFVSLVANTGIKIQVLAKRESIFTISVSQLSAIDTIPEQILDKYSDFCIEQAKKELPMGVFFTLNDNFYFTISETNEVAQVKTDELELQILIPLIADTGTKVLIEFYLLQQDVIYVNNIILTEDLPEDIANEYIERYKSHFLNTLYNFTGEIGVINDKYAIITNYGNYYLFSENQNIINFITNNVGTTVKVHGYLDIDSYTINIIELEY